MSKELKNWVQSIHDRPDTYVGSVENTQSEQYVYINGKLERKTIKKYNQGLVNIIKEIADNIIDHAAESDGEMKYIDITADMDGTICMENDGKAIPVKKKWYDYENPYTGETEKLHLYPGELYFGYFLSGTNYDDTKNRYKGGRNGMGSKATNALSESFKVEIVDSERGKKFTQVYKDKLASRGEPKVVASKNKSNMVRITFVPDWSYFGWTGMTKDLQGIIGHMACYAAMITGLRVTFNGTRIPCNSLVKYAKLLVPQRKLMTFASGKGECVLIESDPEAQDRERDTPQVVGYVNSLRCDQGVHITDWSDKIFGTILTAINSGIKGTKKATKRNLYPYFTLVVKVQLNKPKFDTQTKTNCTGPVFTIKKDDLPVIKEQLAKVSKWAFKRHLLDKIQNVDIKEGKVQKNISIGSQGHDAPWARLGKHREQTTLIITEGKSAAANVWAAIRYLEGGEKANGVVAARGKMLNIENAPAAKIAENAEIKLIFKTMLGIRRKADYNNPSEQKTLRYGRVAVQTDADVDGTHIKCLLVDILYVYNPTLLPSGALKIVEIRTAVAKLFKGVKFSLDNVTHIFYKWEDYEAWKEENPNSRLNVRYYKGLGTSSAAEFQEYYSEAKFIEYKWTKPSANMLKVAFNKKQSNDRKNIILETKHDLSLVMPDKVKIHKYIHDELPVFWRYANIRAIPQLMDGFKDSTRKIMYIAFQFKGDFKIEALGGKVVADANYHHGAKSVEDAAVGLAQSFAGANNIPLLSDDGSFGYRYNGGVTDTAARYLFSSIRDITHSLLVADDNAILEYHLDETNKPLDPKRYLPVLPLAVINPQRGIGAGWNTNIPGHNPTDIIKYIELWLTKGAKARKYIEILPWYRGFEGTITKEGEAIVMRGNMQETDKGYRITELPISIAHVDFKDLLEEMKQDKLIKGYDDSQSTINRPIFEITTKNSLTEDDFAWHTKESKGKSVLVQKLDMNNMTLLDMDLVPKKYADVYEILDDFCTLRIAAYTKRKVYLLEQLDRQLKIATNRKRFIQEVRATDKKKLDLMRKDTVIEDEMTERGYLKVDGSYQYLKSVPIWSMTLEKIEKLKQEILELKAKIDELQNKSEADLWLEDIRVFEKAYAKYLDEKAKWDSYDPKKKTKKGRGKKI